eukprot:755961-Hanusia_phi.AAC.4
MERSGKSRLEETSGLTSSVVTATKLLPLTLKGKTARGEVRGTRATRASMVEASGVAGRGRGGDRVAPRVLQSQPRLSGEGEVRKVSLRLLQHDEPNGGPDLHADGRRGVEAVDGEVKRQGEASRLEHPEVCERERSQLRPLRLDTLKARARPLQRHCQGLPVVRGYKVVSRVQQDESRRGGEGRSDRSGGR